MSKEIDPKLALKFRQQIQNNIKAGAKTRKEFRKGIPSTFTAQDGKEYSLTGVSNYAKTSQNKNVKTKNPSFKSVAGSKKNTQVRNASRLYMMADKREGGFTGTQQKVGKKDLQSQSRIGDIETKIGKIEAHHTRMLQMYRPFFEGMSDVQKAELAQFAFDNKYALGDDITNRAMLSEPFHDKIHDFMRERGYQVSTKKLKAGYKYPGVPDLGNTMESRKNALLHFFKNVQDPIERKLNTIKWEQNDAIKPLTKKEMEYASSWSNDKLLKRDLKIPQTDVTELGKPLGGIGDQLKVGKARKLDAALNIASSISTGNIAGAGVQTGTLLAGEALKTQAAQKALAKQIAKLTAKRGAKTTAKLIPGVDIAISGKEAWDYARQGKFDQAGIAALSGAVGWIPGVGDAASAALDLTNTGIDISRLHINSKNKAKTKNNIEAPGRRLKINY